HPRSGRAHTRGAAFVAAVASLGRIAPPARGSVRGAPLCRAGARGAGADAALRPARREPDTAGHGGGAALGSGRSGAGGSAFSAGPLGALRGGTCEIRPPPPRGTSGAGRGPCLSSPPRAAPA